MIFEPGRASNYFEWVRKVLRQTGFEPTRTVTVNSADGFFALLRAGVGVALLSELHLQDQDRAFHFRKLADIEEHFPLSLMWGAKGISPLVQQFLKVVTEVLPKPAGALWEY